jgi:Rrf2 family nitric oxide-sensitive transcriptional repressor
MWLNQRTIDALRIAVALSKHWPNLVRAEVVATTTGITTMNVRKTVNELARAGLVETERGRYGGVRLARAGRHVTLSEVVRAFEPKDCPVAFIEARAGEEPVTRALFKAHREFLRSLDGTAVADMEEA